MKDIITINTYKDVLIISINEEDIEAFYKLFTSKNSSFISRNGISLQIVQSEESKIVIKDSNIIVSMSLTQFDIIVSLLQNYIKSNRKFPLDISLEQLDFLIESNEIKDVVLECGRFNDD